MDTKQEEKLCLSIKKLYGREKEVKLLHSAYERVTTRQQEEELATEYKDENDSTENKGTNGVQLVLIGGQSGTGKSDLVWNTFAKDDNKPNGSRKKKDCLFGYGKFQKRRDSRPLSVVSNIMSDIILSIREKPNHEEYKKKIMAELGNDERLVMSKLVPMVDKCAEVDTSGADILLDTKEGLDQLKCAVRHFLRIVSTVDPTRFPVVMFIDDIQWSCDSTLDMFSSILTDPELQHVMVIGCYRDDEINRDDAGGGGKWIETMSEMATFKKNNQHRITKIRLGNLTLLDIKQILSDMMKLEMDQEETVKLAELIESRTCGNPFHVLELIDYLQAEGLIKRNTLNYRWAWDYDTIQQQTMLSDNVATIVTARMKRFSCEVQGCLRLASCLGFRFCPRVLKLLVKRKVIECENVDQSIQIAIDEGLVESSNDGRLRFVHDKVYETAYEMAASENNDNNNAQAKIHYDIGAALLNYYFNDDSAEGGNLNLDIGREDEILKDDRNVFLCVDQLKLGREYIIENSKNMDTAGRDKIDDFRMRAIKLHQQAAKMSVTYSAFLPAIKYLEESLYLLQRGGIDTFDDDDGGDMDDTSYSTGSDFRENDDDGNDPKVILLRQGEQFLDIVDVKDRMYRFRLYKNCFIGSEAIDAMIRHSLVQTREEAVIVGKKLCEVFDLFSHVTGDHEFKDGHLFYEFNSIETSTKHKSATTATDGEGDHGIFCALYIEISTKLAEMYVITGQMELATKIVDRIMTLRNIDSETKLPIYLIKGRILSNQSKHREVVKKALYVLNFLDGMNYSYVEEPGHLRFKLELQRMKWNLNKLSDEDILSLPLIQDDNKEHKRIIYVMQFIELALFEAFQCNLAKLMISLSCRFVQLSLDNGIAPLSPMGFALLANRLFGTENNNNTPRHSPPKFPTFPHLKVKKLTSSENNNNSTAKFPALPNLPNLPNLKISAGASSSSSEKSNNNNSRDSSSSTTSKFPKLPSLKVPPIKSPVTSNRPRVTIDKKNRDSDRDHNSTDMSCRLSNLAIALTKKQSDANIVAKGMAGVYFSSAFVKHLKHPLALVVDDLIKGYEFGMKVGDIPNSFRNITTYFMFYFYSGLPLVPLLPDLKRFMQQMMDYSSYTDAQMNIPVYQCVLNLTGRNNMLKPVDFRHGTATDLRAKIGATNDSEDETYDGEQAEWSFRMQIAFYCGEMEIAWEMYEKVQKLGSAHLKGGSPFHQARVFFFALIEMWYAKSTGKHKYNQDAVKHVRVMRGWVNNQGMINCVHKLQILEAELLSLEPNQNLDKLKKAYDTAIVSATRAGFLQDAAVANYLAGIHFKRVLLNDNNGRKNDSNRESTSSTSSSHSISASFSKLPDLSTFRASSTSTASTKSQSSSLSISSIDPDNYFLQARDTYDTWGAAAIIKSLESNFPTIFRDDKDSVPTSKRGTTGFRSRERFKESVQTTHKKLPDHLRASIHHMAANRTSTL